MQCHSCWVRSSVWNGNGGSDQPACGRTFWSRWGRRRFQISVCAYWEQEGATRIISYVVSGIGFLGAGVILKDGTNIRGLNTAATLWCSAAVGTLSGSGLPGEAATLAAFVLAGNTLLRPLVNWVNRRPIDSSVTEAKYLIHAVCRAQDVSDVRDLLDRELSRANYPIREVETLSANEDQVELAAILVPTAAEDAELDAVVSALEASPLVLSATWSVEATA